MTSRPPPAVPATTCIRVPVFLGPDSGRKSRFLPWPSVAPPVIAAVTVIVLLAVGFSGVVPETGKWVLTAWVIPGSTTLRSTILGARAPPRPKVTDFAILRAPDNEDRAAGANEVLSLRWKPSAEKDLHIHQLPPQPPHATAAHGGEAEPDRLHQEAVWRTLPHHPRQPCPPSVPHCRPSGGEASLSKGDVVGGPPPRLLNQQPSVEEEEDGEYNGDGPDEAEPQNDDDPDEDYDEEEEGGDRLPPGAEGSTPPNTRKLAKPKCKCGDDLLVVNCTSPRKIELLKDICRLKKPIQNRRRDFTCKMDAANRFLNRREWAQSNRVRDTARRHQPCNQTMHSFKSKPSAYLTYQMTSLQKSPLEVVPLIAAASKLAPLWTPPPARVFYTGINMWAFRGWDKNGKKLHREPFTKTTVPFLPAETPNLGYDSCAVVGNDGGLLNRKQGWDIDGHTAVIRMNQAPTNRRVAPHVGNRTDVRIINRAWARLYAARGGKLLNKEKPGMLLLASRAATVSIHRLGKVFQRQHANKRVLFPTTQIIIALHHLVQDARMVLEEALGVEYGGGSSPSTGLVSLFLAMQMCKQVDVYGFALQTCYGPKCPSYHYFRRREVTFDNPRITIAFRGHQYDVEGMIIKAWHVMGLICVKPEPKGLGPCGSGLGGLVNKDGVVKDRSSLLQLDAILGRSIKEDAVRVASTASKGSKRSTTSTTKGNALSRGRSSPGPATAQARPAEGEAVQTVPQAVAEEGLPAVSTGSDGGSRWEQAVPDHGSLLLSRVEDKSSHPAAGHGAAAMGEGEAAIAEKSGEAMASPPFSATAVDSRSRTDWPPAGSPRTKMRTKRKTEIRRKSNKAGSSASVRIRSSPRHRGDEGDEHNALGEL